MMTRKVGFLLYDGMNALDLSGPLEAFNTATEVCPHSPYELVFIGKEKKPYRTESGLSMSTDISVDSVAALDKVAADVARFLVVHLRRAGDQAQFSVPLQNQIKTDSTFAGLTGWILENLHTDLSIERLASYCWYERAQFLPAFQ